MVRAMFSVDSRDKVSESLMSEGIPLVMVFEDFRLSFVGDMLRGLKCEAPVKS